MPTKKETARDLPRNEYGGYGKYPYGPRPEHGSRNGKPEGNAGKGESKPTSPAPAEQKPVTPTQGGPDKQGSPAKSEQKKQEKNWLARGVDRIKALFTKRKDKKVGPDKDTIAKLTQQIEDRDKQIAEMVEGRRVAEENHAKEKEGLQKQIQDLEAKLADLAKKLDEVADAIDGGSGKPEAEAALKDDGALDLSAGGVAPESEAEKLKRQAEEEGARLAGEHDKNMSDAAGRIGDDGQGVDNIQYWGKDKQPSPEEAAALLMGKSGEAKTEEPIKPWMPDFNGAGWQDDDSDGHFYDPEFHPGNSPKKEESQPKGESGQARPVEVEVGGQERTSKNEGKKSSLPERHLEGLSAEQVAQVERIRNIAQAMSPEERARIKKELEHDLESRALEYADRFPRSGEGRDAKYNMTRLVVDSWNRADGKDYFADEEQLKRAIVYGEAAKEIQENRVEKQMEALSAAYTEYFAPGGQKAVSLQETDSVGSDRIGEVVAAYGKYMGPESTVWETVADTARRIIDGWNVSQGKDWFVEESMVKNALLQAMRTVNSSRR